MSEMIERVEQVLNEHFWREDRHGTDDSQRLYIRTAALAAIEAMREPTQPMLQAAGDDWYEADLSWRMMIDAAIKSS